jgi:hypothetical protein
VAKCSAIAASGNPCKGVPVDGSQWCYHHHPDNEHKLHTRGQKGGNRGGRGRPTSELKRLGARFEELAEQVLAGEVDRGIGAVAGQLLNGARACIRDSLAAREQEELVERLERLEEGLERNKGSSYAS